jgi:hypothetical protein
LQDLQGQRETAQSSLSRAEMLLKQANQEVQSVEMKVKGQ